MCLLNIQFFGKHSPTWCGFYWPTMLLIMLRQILSAGYLITIDEIQVLIQLLYCVLHYSISRLQQSLNRPSKCTSITSSGGIEFSELAYFFCFKHAVFFLNYLPSFCLKVSGNERQKQIKSCVSLFTLVLKFFKQFMLLCGSRILWCKFYVQSPKDALSLDLSIQCLAFHFSALYYSVLHRSCTSLQLH